MKHPLIAIVILTPLFCLAQKDNPDSLRGKYFELNVKTLPPADIRLPFQTIKVIDGRPDTSKLGYRTNKIFATASLYQKILLKSGISAGIENFYNDYYKNNFTQNGKVLLISMRKLWIDNTPDRNIKSSRRGMERQSLKDVYAKFEYYYGSNNTYVPLLRMDTIFQLMSLISNDAFKAENEGQLPFLCFSLEQLIEKINYNFYLENAFNRKKMSVENIMTYNAAAFDLPILTEDIKQGVFMSFDEFKNNRPSIIDFNKRILDKKKIEEIVDGKGLAVVQYFAYYDGKKLSIRKPLSTLNSTKRNQYNQGIYRIGNGFQFFETATDIYRGGAVTAVGRNTINSPVSNIIMTYVPRVIDMETGEMY